MPKRDKELWQMSEEQGKYWNDLSGNEINGLGETEFRRPKIVYWPNDSRRKKDGPPPVSKHPFGPLINWFRMQSPAVMDVYTDFKNRAPLELGPVIDTPEQDTPESWTARVKKFVLDGEGDLVGITALKAEWFFDDATPTDHLTWVIMIGSTMDYDKMQHMPPTTEDPTSAVEVGEIYNMVDRQAGKLAQWIRDKGWEAENQGGPSSGKMLLTPPALECGFGELGKHGSIINRQYGSLIRLSAVRTNLPLIPDAPDEFGADDFCTRCQVCTNACHVDAILDEKQMVRGEKKWYVDFDKCVPYFNENYACGICIAVCPWSRPETAPKLAEKMLRRRKRKSES